MTGKSAIAPCGHRGEHITTNYIACREGCDSPKAVASPGPNAQYVKDLAVFAWPLLSDAEQDYLDWTKSCPITATKAVVRREALDDLRVVSVVVSEPRPHTVEISITRFATGLSAVDHYVVASDLRYRVLNALPATVGLTVVWDGGRIS